MAVNLNEWYSRSDLYWRRHPIMRWKAKRKAKHDRIVKGWCDADLTDLDMWFLETIAQMLYAFVNKSDWCPPIAITDSDKEQKRLWKDTMYKLADDLCMCLEKNYRAFNEFADEVDDVYRHAQFENGKLKFMREGDQEIRDKYLAREGELWEEREKRLTSCFERLRAHFNELWM